MESPPCPVGLERTKNNAEKHFNFYAAPCWCLITVTEQAENIIFSAAPCW